MLLELDDLDSLPETYYILEVSANLRERQRLLLSTLPEEIYARVKWIDDFPEKPFDGVIIGNEFLDALPVNCFQILNDDVAERCVKYENKKFAWQSVPATNKDLIQHVNRVREKYPLSEGYKSEVNLALPQWIKRMSAALKSGIILLLDYGYPRHEYFRPERIRGTMMCHYQHRRHEDPYQLYGLQDITAHVDFTTIAETAVDANLKVAGYTNQASFLLACGIMDIAEKQELPPREEYQQNYAIKILTLPAEMGETIKVISLTRNIPCMLTGYQVEDWRKTL
jgi:SAM-dependent MidA family methyltransferase